MSTKFDGFLKAKKIDPRRILVASAEIERLRPHDRAVRLAKRLASKTEDKKKEGIALEKPRTGKPVTERSMTAAIAGKQLSGPIKTRILRAVNHVLQLKKQEQVDLAALFDATARPKKAEKKAE